MNNYTILPLVCGIFFFFLSNLSGQINISNRSFEGQVSDASMPSGWFSQSKGTTPDILPGYWGVYLEPEEGETYVGLITRQDGSNESIGQRTDKVLNKGQCYQFSIDLAYSDNYSGYNSPIRLRIWVSSKNGQREQMIFESSLIENIEWKKYSIKFTPENDMQYFILEAFISEKPIYHKGNILLDNMSNIFECNRA